MPISSKKEPARPAGTPEFALERAAQLERGSTDPMRRRLQRYWPLYAAAAAGVVATLASIALSPGLAVVCGASAFFLTYIVIALGRLPRMTPRMLRVHADESDTPGIVLLIIAITAVILAIASLLLLLNGGRSPERFEIVLGIISVLLGWLGLNSMIAFHYAYEYYGTDESSPAGKDGHRNHIGGLNFPGKELPDGLSFLYFSFVVAMTAQVSDVTVTSNHMRKLVLLHGILAFFFNTVILATAVNVIVSIGHGP
ncbi:MAG TPA: DUF1345 domain-containing protein [Devosiaceae bacterium]|nr:DUF1345 domain-containing protein [Devosiaceae bacterium]